MKYIYLVLLSLFFFACSNHKVEPESSDSASQALELSISKMKLEQKSILAQIQERNNKIEFNDKESEVDKLFERIQTYNTSVKNIPSNPSMNAYLINETKESLKNKINAYPSIDFKIQKCSGLIYLGCKAKFKPYVKDENTTLSYLWDFGDGITSVKRYPIHSYKKLGRFRVTMKVSDSKGGVTLASKYLIVENRAPVAKFELKSNTFRLKDSVKFSNKSYDLDGSIKNYYWNFGDKESSKKKNPSHVYETAGTYIVTLNVKDNRGKIASSKRKITIKHPVNTDVNIGMSAFELVSLLGIPDKRTLKSESDTQGFLYYTSWVIIKKDLVECVVDKDGFKQNIFGSPRECVWHKINSSKYIVK